MKVKSDDNITLKQNGNNSVSMDTNEPDAASLETVTPFRASLRLDETKVRFNVRESGGPGGTSDYEELENKPEINGVELIGDKNATELGLMPWTDLGDVDISLYDWDYWEFLNDKTETGFYRFHEINDEFDYFVKVENAGDCVYQEAWLTEETSTARYTRHGRFDGEAWDWFEYSETMDAEQIATNYYSKSETNQLLNGKVDNDTLGNYYTDAQVDDILDNNYYNIDTIDGMFEEFVPNNMISTTWANLVELRDNDELQAGSFYRITDYNFISTKINVISANHQFDIIVLAVSENMLSESAYAARHPGDHYFEREITVGGIEWLYTLYVDDYAENYGDEPVDHAEDMHPNDIFCDYTYDINPDTGDEVPVLYKTDGEEYSIDEPDYDDMFFYSGTYDLDGDEYDLWAKYEPDPGSGDLVFMQQYALTPIVVEDDELIVSPIPETKIVPVNMSAWELKYCLDNDKDLFDWAATEGKGVIYYMKDEFGNEAPYDFKNALFQRKNITGVSSSILSAFTQGENSRLGLPNNYAITCGNSNYYYYTFDSPYNAGNDSSLFGESAYNIIKPYIVDGQRIINNIVLGFANNNNIGNNCFDLTLWGTVRENNLAYNCSNLLIVGLTQSVMTYVRTSTFFSLGATIFGNGCSQNIGNMFTNSEIGESCNNNNFGTGNMQIKMGSGCANNTFGTYSYSNTFDNGVSNCTFGNYVSYNYFEKSVSNITLPNYTRYCKFETSVSRITFTTSGGNYSNYIQYVTVKMGVSNLTVAPTRRLAYEQIYYKTGRTETPV